MVLRWRFIATWASSLSGSRSGGGDAVYLRFELALPLLAGEPCGLGRGGTCNAEAGVVVVDIEDADGADEVSKKV